MSANANHDIFAQIASRRIAYRTENLVTPEPPPRPTRTLPLAPVSRPKPLPHAKRIDTPAALQRELERWRKRMAPFMRRLAPPDATTRDRLDIDRFDWRVETETDRRDGAVPMAGAGAWTKVTIPHYGEPLARAVTYYRTTFTLTKAMLSRGAMFIRFGAVDYKATVFINNTHLGSHEGFFSPFEFDFTHAACRGRNTLFVKVENDAICGGNGSWSAEGHLYEGDKIYAATGPGYDEPVTGWHHCPPGMGIWQGVSIEARAQLHVSDIFVRPLNLDGDVEAWIEIWNADKLRHDGRLTLAVNGENFKQDILKDIDGGSRTFGPRVNYIRVPLHIPDARLWEPETPWLYRLQVTLANKEGLVTDVASQTFGIRTFTMDETQEPRGNLIFNGRPLRLRGANTMGHEQQCVLKKDWDQLRDDILLARIGNLNFLRLTQRPVQPEIYDFCDRLGLMAQSDLPLFGVLRRNQFCEAVRQAEEMEKLIRSHPCSIMISYINEPTDSQWLNQRRHLTRTELERFFEAASQAVRVQNPDRVIKPVDGDYDPPAPGLPDNHCYCCWYNGHGVDVGRLQRGYWQPIKPGWYYGCGEFGAEGLDPLDLMLRRYPKSWLPAASPAGQAWTPRQIPKAQTGHMHYLWFETPDSPEAWVARSQAHQAWATKLMTEAFRRDTRMVSIAIHLFIDAFPSGWMKTIMDVERQPKPSYFAYRDALTPVMASLRCDRRNAFAGEILPVDVWVCNDTPEGLKGHKLSYEVRLPDGTRLRGESPLTCGAVTAKAQGCLRLPLPETLKGERGTAGIELVLLAADGRAMHTATFTVTVFPRPAKAARRTLCVVGAPDGKAARLCRELGQTVIHPKAGSPIHTPVILIDDLQMLEAVRAEVDQAVNAGARAILLEVPRMKGLTLADTTLEIRGTGMGPAHVASRKTGHPMVAGFQPEDFTLWYHPGEGYVTPLLDTVFQSEAWTPILAAGAGGFGTPWDPALVVAEKSCGKGQWTICQLKLTGRTRHEPTANAFARRLLGLD